MVKSNGVHPDTYRLLLFQFSLRDKASKWLESFPKESLTTWEDVMSRFLTRFYPPQRVNRLRIKVQTFRQQDGKTLYEAWERFKDLTKKCPLDMFNEWVQIHTFYEGLNYESRKAVDHSSRGSLNKKKNIDEAIGVIETVADNEYFYASDRSNNRGVLELNQMDTILAQNKMITKKFAELTKQMEKNQAAAIHTQSLPQEELETEERPNWEEAKYLGNSSSHKNHSQHPNFNQPPPHDDDRMTRMGAMLANLYKECEDIKKFQEEERGNMKSRGEVLKNLEAQVGHLSQWIPKLTDSFPSDTEKNLREEMKKVRWEECKAVTLANEEILEEDTSEPTEHNQGSPRSNMEKKEQGTGSVQGKDSTRKETLKPYVPKAPFPQRLKGGEKEKSYSRFLDMFASLSVNIPYLKILKQMPTCINWMKELLARKSNLKGGQIVVMNKECSALIQKDVHLKRKDPRSFLSFEGESKPPSESETRSFTTDSVDSRAGDMTEPRGITL
ncbi:uncharacterized protein [Arachis hypogaea]|uniref:uncharacterized protein n=1 Tax=Arachis hypogaea TaxID=3818 RepID=UPI000DEC37C3|nr:uncharacterized protein LOC112742718 [Arachis hypogaea]